MLYTSSEFSESLEPILRKSVNALETQQLLKRLSGVVAGWARGGACPPPPLLRPVGKLTMLSESSW